MELYRVSHLVSRPEQRREAILVAALQVCSKLVCLCHQECVVCEHVGRVHWILPCGQLQARQQHSSPGVPTCSALSTADHAGASRDTAGQSDLAGLCLARKCLIIVNCPWGRALDLIAEPVLQEGGLPIAARYLRTFQLATRTLVHRGCSHSCRGRSQPSQVRSPGRTGSMYGQSGCN